MKHGNKENISDIYNTYKQTSDNSKLYFTKLLSHVKITPTFYCFHRNSNQNIYKTFTSSRKKKTKHSQNRSNWRKKTTNYK